MSAPAMGESSPVYRRDPADTQTLRHLVVEQILRLCDDDTLAALFTTVTPDTDAAFTALGLTIGTAPQALTGTSPLDAMFSGSPLADSWREQMVAVSASTLWSELETHRLLHGPLQPVPPCPFAELVAYRLQLHDGATDGR